MYASQSQKNSMGYAKLWLAVSASDTINKILHFKDLYVPYPGSNCFRWVYLSHVVQKPVFGVFNQGWHKPLCSAAEAS